MLPFLKGRTPLCRETSPLSAWDRSQGHSHAVWWPPCEAPFRVDTCLYQRATGAVGAVTPGDACAERLRAESWTASSSLRSRAEYSIRQGQLVLFRGESWAVRLWAGWFRGLCLCSRLPLTKRGCSSQVRTGFNACQASWAAVRSSQTKLGGVPRGVPCGSPRLRWSHAAHRPGAWHAAALLHPPLVSAARYSDKEP